MSNGFAEELSWETVRLMIAKKLSPTILTQVGLARVLREDHLIDCWVPMRQVALDERKYVPCVHGPSQYWWVGDWYDTYEAAMEAALVHGLNMI